MTGAVWVGLGGFAGAIARYWIGASIGSRLGTGFPWSTLFINLSGSFVLGVLVGLFETRTVPPALRLALTSGFLSAYTTFSTFSYETLALVETGHPVRALVYVAGSVAAGLACALLGVTAGRAL